jgi:hypothetical protein
MKRSTIYCLIFLALFSFGFKLSSDTDALSHIYLIGSTLIRTTPTVDIKLYDIADPADPRVLSTIPIEGNHDVAVRGSYMYADNGWDLVVYDISDRSNPKAVDTVVNTFNLYPRFLGEDMIFESGSSGCNSCTQENAVDAAPAANTGGATGKAGSLARFAIIGDRLYCLNYSQIAIYDISNPASPVARETFYAGREIETLFPANGLLFVGGTEGMYIYDVSQPGGLTQVSEFRHARSCDPVAVEGVRAYVTLRAGSPCGSQGDQLDILDVSTITSPTLLNTVPMSGPYGLAVRGDTLVVCDGNAGLKILNVADPARVVEIGRVSAIVPHDVILDGRLMIVTTDAGFYLYDVTEIASPRLYGHLQ